MREGRIRGCTRRPPRLMRALSKAILIVATLTGCGHASNKWVGKDLAQFQKAFDDSLIIHSTDLPVARVGKEYDFTLDASGGCDPVLWRIVSGPLPSGVQLASDGAFHGTPTTPGVATFVLKARCQSLPLVSVRGESPHVGWRMRQFSLVVKETVTSSPSNPPGMLRSGSGRGRK
jgi:hypothetical protein